MSEAASHNAGDRRSLRQPLLLHQQRQRLKPTATSRDLEHARFDTIGIKYGPDVQALQESTAGNVLGQLFDRHTGLDAPDVGLAQHQFVKGDIP